MKTLNRGKQQISLLTLPSHGDTVNDAGSAWIVKMSGGFMLRKSASECHPDFVGGAMDALSFAAWFNEAFA